MTKKELKSFIENYKKVEEKIEHAIEVLQHVDYYYYHTGRSFLGFEISDNRVSISLIDSCGDYESTGFNADWLFLTDEELIEVGKEDKIKREEEKKRREKETADRYKKDKEKKEYEMYLKFKEKFEQEYIIPSKTPTK